MSLNPSMTSLIQSLETLINKRNLALVDQIFASDYVGYVPSMPNINRAAFKVLVHNFKYAFPDFRMEINHQIVTDNEFVLQVTFSGTHQGTFIGIPSTGAEVNVEAISTFRVEDGLIIESWSLVDIFGLIKQVSSENGDPLLPLPNPN